MVLGDYIQIHKSTVCRVIKTVSTEIARLRPQFIQFPSSAAEQQRVQLGFLRLHQFPRVIGVLDCSHIRIQSTKSDIGEQFRNRKGYLSFYVQAICDSNLKILNIVAR